MFTLFPQGSVSTPMQALSFYIRLQKEARFFWSLPAKPPQGLNPLFLEKL
jgi:hypothetical protein